MGATITPRVIASRNIWESAIQVEWADRKLRKAQGSDGAGRRLLGDGRWSALKRRIRALEVADSLADLRGQAGGFHALMADRTGEWSATLTPNWRLVFEPADDPLPTLPDGGLDTAQVRRVRVLRVEDYHRGH
jgi:plasmid maintenance system killer protein